MCCRTTVQESLLCKIDRRSPIANILSLSKGKGRLARMFFTSMFRGISIYGS